MCFSHWYISLWIIVFVVNATDSELVKLVVAVALLI